MDDNPLGRKITPDESDLIGSLFFIGASVGPLVFAKGADKFGRKKMLSLVTAILPVCFGTFAVTDKIRLYYVCRIAIGFYVGSAFSMVPQYVTEIVSPKDRGFLMSLFSFFTFSGVLSSYILGSYLSLFSFNVTLMIVALIKIFFFVFCCPESPYRIMKLKGKSETRSVLEKLRTEDVDKELEDIEETILESSDLSSVEIFSSEKTLKTIFMASIPLILQQLSGISVIVTYSQLIFKETNISISPKTCSIVVAIIQVITTFFTPLLFKSKRVSKKTIMLFSLSGVGLCNLVISFYFIHGKDINNLNWLPLITLICFVLIYICGLDPVPWMWLGEFYPMNLRSLGSAISTSLYSLSAFPLLYCFNKLGVGYLFMTSAGVCFLGIVYIKFQIAETDGRSLREIQALF